MNNQDKSTFFLRHTEDAKLIGGAKAYEEDTYLNQQHSFSCRSGLHLFGYGDCLWRSRYRQGLQYSRTWWAFEFITEGNGIFICDNIKNDICTGDLVRAYSKRSN